MLDFFRRFVFILMSVAILSNVSYGQGYSDKILKLKNIVRPYIQKVIGENYTNKILGESILIKLPPIPEVDTNAKSTDIFNLKDRNISISKEKESEFNYKFVNEIFLATKNRKANSDEVQSWMNNLDQGGTREGLYRALVLDSSYLGLENYDRPVNDSIIEFSTHYFDKYLSKSVRKEIVEKLNVYTLKREVVERTLEILDELAKEPNDLFSWYAVFSSEVAQKNSIVWKNNFRKKTSKIEHYKWAKSVPTQHIKSEVIVKLHFIFNNLSGI